MAGPVRIAILANGAQASAEFRKTASNATTMGKRFASAGTFAAKAFVGVGVAAAAAGAKFTKDAGQLDTKIREVVTLFGETGKAADRSIGRITDQVRGLSNQFGIAQQAVTGGLYSAISAGVPKSNALEFMQVASKAAIGGVTDVATTVDGLSSTINAFGLKATDAKSVADSMFTAVKGGKTTFEELSNSLFNVAPAAAAAGVSFQEVNAGIAALTAGGTPTSVATTQIRAALTGLQKPSEALDKIFQSLGYENAQLAVESKGLGFALRAVKDASKGNNGELQKLLGSTEAVSAANVIAGTGAKKFNDELRAQKDAAGAAGKAFKTVNSGAERSYERLTTKLSNVGLQIGQTILPFALDAVTALEKKLSPAIDGVGDDLADLSKAFKVDGIDGLVAQIEDMTGTSGKLTPILDELKEAGDGVWRAVKVLGPAFLDAANGATPLLSPLKLVGDVAQVAADVLELLPDGLLELGIQAGAAALILPRLTTAATNAGTQFTLATAKAKQFRAEMSYGVTRSAALTSGLSKLASAARTAGGIGGMLALSKGAEQADTKTGFLLTTLGGAATGFALGGPIGALIGGGAGAAMATFAAKTDDAATSSSNAKRPITDFAESLDQVTGAATESTAALIRLELQQAGAFKAGRELGLSQRDLIQYMSGNERAIARVTKELQTYQGATRVVINPNTGVAQTFYDGAEAVGKLSLALGTTTEALEKNGRQVRRRAREVQDFSRLTKLVPRRVVTQLDLNGVKPTVDGISNVVRRFKLVDKKQIKALIAITGVETSVKEVRKVSDSLRDAGRTKPDFSVAKRSIVDDTIKMRESAAKGSTEIGRKLSEGTKNAKPDTAAFSRGLLQTITTGKTSAGSGGRDIGAQLSLGTASGITANGGAVEAAARQVVSRAVAAAKAEAQIKSPSRRMHDEVGKQLGRGMADGVDATQDRQKRAGRDLVKAVLAGVTNGSSGVGRAIDKITRLVEKQIKAKNPRQEAARERAALRALKGEFSQLEKNGKAQDRINRKLDAARDKYRRLVAESKAYARSVRDGFVSFGSVVGLGQNEDGSVSTTSLLDQLRDRAAAAERYADLIRKLNRAGLNDTTLQQLIDAGVEGGLATAEALTAGGASAISEVNSLTQQIARSGAGLGAAMAKEFKQAGIDAAAGLVAGLKAREKELDKIADRLGNRLARAVKKALGINSPSRVFREIGDNTVKGLALGLDEVYVKRSGERLSQALRSGYGRPQLNPDVFAARSGATAPPLGALRLTAEQVSQLQRGREIAIDLDAYYAAGGRKPA